MKVRRRFLVALVASILLHVGVITAPGWVLPSLDDLLNPKKADRLDAWLAKPRGKMAAPARPRPKPARPKPSPDAVVATNMPVPPPEPAVVPAPGREPAIIGGQADDRQPDGAPAATSIPFSHVLIHYDVIMGDRGLVIGEASQEFRKEGTSYQLRSVTATTGLARLFKRVDLVHTSSGEIVDGVLRPSEFRIERDGTPGESAVFDWPQGLVWLGERSFKLEPGAQDMLSMFCQLALTPIDGPSVTLPVVTGKKVERYEFAVLGEEALTTPLGEQPTLHLHTEGEGPEATDVWLGLNFARLPIRIRYVDRKGEAFDQVASRVEVETNVEGDH